MTHRRSTGLAVLGAILLGMAGCEERLPESGSRAIVPADHLEKQRREDGADDCEHESPVRAEARKSPMKQPDNEQQTTDKVTEEPLPWPAHLGPVSR